MFAIGGFLIGAVLGAFRARRLGGKPADMAQYAFGFGILLGLIGLILSLVIYRLNAA